MSRQIGGNTVMQVLLVLLLTVVTMVLPPFLSEAARTQDYRGFSRYSPGDLTPGDGAYGPETLLAVQSEREIGELLRSDGTVDLKTGFRGAINPRGYRLVGNPTEAPRFEPVSAAGDEGWADGFGAMGVDNEVYALAVDGSGNLYAGGSFTTAGGIAANHIAKWNGASWEPLGSGMNDVVSALAVDGSGKLYAGGSFTMAGGVAASRIAKWDGATWQSLGSGIHEFDGYDYYVFVNALAVDGSGNLYAGGVFEKAGGVAANNIAKWNGASWQPLGSGVSDWALVGCSVEALAVDGNGNLYAGGCFWYAGEVNANKIAKWNGVSWEPLGRGIGEDDFTWVNALAVDGNGNLYAGGSFTTAGEVAANNIAKWNGVSWEPLGSGIGKDDFTSVDGLAVDGSGNLYAGGSFTTAGEVAANNIAKWNGASWEPLGSGTDARVYALAPDGNGSLYVGGSFTTAGGKSSSRIARWTETLPDYSIFGTVTSGGNAVLGVTINLAGAASESGATNANGNYTFSGLSSGTYTITPGKLGYTFTPSSISVEVTDTNVRGQNFDATLIGFSVSGNVTSNGSAVPGVTINLIGAASQSTTTDSDGNYNFSGVISGAYTITPGKLGYTFTPSSISVEVTDTDITGQNFDATFIGYSLSGTVTSNGSAISGVTINLTGAASQSTTTDSNGNYSLSGLSNGEYTITPGKAGYTSFTPPSRSVNVIGTNVTGQNFTTSPQLQVFARGGDNAPYERLWDGSKWHSWYRLTGLINEAPAVTSHNGQLQLFVRGMDYALYQLTWDGSNWHGWYDLGGYLASAPAVVSHNGQLYVFVVGGDHALWWMYWDGSNWHGWYPLGGYILGSPAAVSYNGQLHVFVSGGDHGLWQLTWDGSKWNGWYGLGGYLAYGPGAANWNGQLHVFVTGVDYGLWQMYSDGSQWHGWFLLGGYILGSPAAVGDNGQLDVCVTGGDHAIWWESFNGTNWFGWHSLGGYTLSAPGVASYAPGG